MAISLIPEPTRFPGLQKPSQFRSLVRCIKRLTDLPMLWSEQWGAIGLQAPAQVRAELS